jgi:hypothetical protein
MTRRHWPATLDEVLAEPITPRCPVVCPFRELCPTHVQEGTVQLLAAGRLAGPSDCTWYQRMVLKVEEELGPGPVPVDAAALRRRLQDLRVRGGA